MDVKYDKLINKEDDTFIPVSDLAGDMNKGDDLTPDDAENTSSSVKHNLWQLQYYQEYFDVDTKTILNRLFYSIIPFTKKNFLNDVLKPNVDMYGPFWISTTLIFIIAVSGNLSSYLYSHDSPLVPWHYDFQKVTMASTIVYLYWWLGPLVLWGFFKCFMRKQLNNNEETDEQNEALMQSSSQKDVMLFTDLLAVFGYSKALLVIVSILWIIQFQLLQWILCLFAVIASSTLIIKSIWTDLCNLNKMFTLAICIGVLLCQFVYIVSLMLLFFSGVIKLDSAGAFLGVKNATILNLSKMKS